ncbi:MAG TPA: ATP-dependent DNA helicase RecG [Thermoleophilia bacterium]|nr:ATP-dependent DNA helicase RecG [Thermoleophilia bacterium]
MTGQPLPLRFGGGRYDQPPPVTRLSFDPASLERPLAGLEHVTANVARRLKAFGLETVGDLCEHFPRRYEDFRDRKAIRDLKVGEEATIRGEIVRVRAERTARRRVDIVKVLVRDDTGAVEAVWFNQKYLTKVLAEGMKLSLRGTFRPQSGRQQFVVKGHEILEEDEGEGVHTEGVVPVYPASEQVSAKLLRGLVHQLAPVMRRLPDPLPAELLVRERLPGRADAVMAVHLPRTLAEARRARERLVLEELLLMQVGLLLHKREQQARVRAHALPEPGELAHAFLDGLPFELTTHQLAALDELEADLGREEPMRRLLQGDVGSGKTVVALYCLLRAAEAGYQGVLLAPTETLAAQHADTAARLIGPLASTELVTASLTAKERREALARMASGETRVAIGTHALLQGDVRFAGLALLVVDEQHRFGVEQRDALVRRAERGGCAPHVLHMTATPIPRTLALTVFGDLDVTTIAGVPSGRQPVVTRLVDEEKRDVGYDFVRKQIARGRQVYVVCPAIDESESIDAATAVAEAERLQAGPFRDARVAVVHGQLRSADRDAVMRAFKAADLDVLVSTSLIEVGIDVPNATVMIVEGADRFGLAQLHQLRGRVGRGSEKSYCLLFSSAETGSAQARLEALLETNDGFELADKDLEIRGEGQVMGTRQAGVPDLKLARLARDRALLLRARELAAGILAADPGLTNAVNGPLKDAMQAAFGHELGWLLKA